MRMMMSLAVVNRKREMRATGKKKRRPSIAAAFFFFAQKPSVRGPVFSLSLTILSELFRVARERGRGGGWEEAKGGKRRGEKREEKKRGERKRGREERGERASESKELVAEACES